MLSNLQRATVTLAWPSKMEMEGFGPSRVDAERLAAAAACHTLRVSTIHSFSHIRSNTSEVYRYFLSLSFEPIVVFSLFVYFVCVFVQEMGLLGPGNKLPSKGSGLDAATVVSEGCEAARSGHGGGGSGRDADAEVEAAAKSDYAEALSLFPHPKALVVHVLQVAMPSASLKVSHS